MSSAILKVKDVQAVKVVLPRGNDRDLLAAEIFISSLRSNASLALEIGATPAERMLMLRGSPASIKAASSQLRNLYPQCEVVPVDIDEDPARAGAPARHCVELRLREPLYLPIRTHVSREGRATFDDMMRAGDPMLAVLSAMDGLHAGESCLVQFALRAMPDDWSKFWRGAARDVDVRTKKAPASIAGLLLGVMGGFGLIIGALIVLLALFLGVDAGLLLSGVVMGLVGGALIYLRLKLPSPPNPALVMQKTGYSAFQVRIQLHVACQSEAEAEARMDQLISAFWAYNLSSGNGFRPLKLTGVANPNEIDFKDESLLANMPAIGFLRRPWQQYPILNMMELAALWHLPHAQAGYQGVATASSRQIAPLPSDVVDGICIGSSMYQGTSIPVHLPQAFLRGNIGLIAKTQSGKSNLMAVIASDVIAHEQEASVIVIDPHTDLVRAIARNLPEGRREKSIYWSLADTERPFGLNLIERRIDSPRDANAIKPDKVASNIIEAFREIWEDNWGPRMEDYLRWPLLTLATANELMVTDFNFRCWQHDARMLIKGCEDAINKDRLDAQAESMIEATRKSFLQLQPPRRPGAARDYQRLWENYSKYLHASGAEGKPAERLKAAQAIHRQLFKDVTADAAVDSGISSRIYAPEGCKDTEEQRPLQYTLLDIQPLQVSSEMRKTVLSALAPEQYEHIHRWWREYNMYARANARFLVEMITPVRTKLRRFDASDIARRIFGQPESTIDLSDVIQGGGVLLVDLSAGIVGKDTAALIGSTLLNTLTTLLFAQSRQADRQQRRDVFIVVDEFQSIPGADFETMLGELAKYGARIMLGTQSLGVLAETNRKLRPAWLDNTSTLFVFRCGAHDAEVMAAELATSTEDRLTVSAADIVGLPDYTCYVRTRTAGRQVKVFSIKTRKMDAGSADVFESIRERSRRVHGRDAAAVDAWLAEARKDHGTPDLLDRAGAPRNAGGDANWTTEVATDNSKVVNVELYRDEAMPQSIR